MILERKKLQRQLYVTLKDINEAKGVLFNITSGDDFSLNELNQINALILEKVRDDATVMVSTTVDNTLENILFLDVWYRTQESN